VRRPSIKSLSVRRRSLGITARGKLEAKRLRKILSHLKQAIAELQAIRRPATRLIKLYREIMVKYVDIAFVPLAELTAKLRTIERKYLKINDLIEEDIHINFRFRTKQQLHRLRAGFQFPAVMKSGKVTAFSGEEVMLLGLYRLARPTRLVDVGFEHLFGFNYVEVSVAFRLFLDHLCDNWAHLLKDNMLYWKPKLADFAECIRVKLHEHYNCTFAPVNQDGGFRVFGFIDNTMNATCRPGGGPARDGVDAPRNDPLIQRAWYNGWKKMHGMKWQTVDLPNGMNFHVWGPVSLRHNDMYTLHHSHINDLLTALQANDVLKFAIYGDSAYCITLYDLILARHDNPVNTPREVLENRSMSSCREVIEWDYGDVGKYWAYVDYKKILQLRKMPVGRSYFVAMLLRNAYVTLNGGNTSQFYECIPPTFEHWVTQSQQPY